MIRLLLLTFIPLLLPFVAWFIWKVFRGKPVVDAHTGDQVPPDIQKAPRGKLLAAGFVLMFVTIGTFLLFHHRFAEEPYKGIDVDAVERKLEEEKMRLRQQNAK